jgi:hypothetical protein
VIVSVVRIWPVVRVYRAEKFRADAPAAGDGTLESRLDREKWSNLRAKTLGERSLPRDSDDRSAMRHPTRPAVSKQMYEQIAIQG